MLKHVLLGLLEHKGHHGYELRAAFEELTGGTWQVNEGQVYATLARLERDGLVRSSVIEQTLLPNRRVYELTPAGTLELKQWLAEPGQEPVRLREEWFVKVLLGVLVAPERCPELIGAQRVAGLRRLAELGEIRDDPSTPVATELVVEAALGQVEAGLRWLDVCEEQLKGLDQSNLEGLDQNKEGA